MRAARDIRVNMQILNTGADALLRRTSTELLTQSAYGHVPEVLPFVNQCRARLHGFAVSPHDDIDDGTFSPPTVL